MYLYYFREFYIESTAENPAWYTVEDNHASLISEDVEKIIKIETDLIDDCQWESRIDITKSSIQSSSLAHLPKHKVNSLSHVNIQS